MYCKRGRQIFCPALGPCDLSGDRRGLCDVSRGLRLRSKAFRVSKERAMLGVSPWMWAWMGALAPGLWFVRAVIGAFLVDRVTRTVVEKADVKDLPEMLTVLGVLAGVLAASSRPVPRTTISTAAAAIGAGSGRWASPMRHAGAPTWVGADEVKSAARRV